jgi:hypothetical protein
LKLETRKSLYLVLRSVGLEPGGGGRHPERFRCTPPSIVRTGKVQGKTAPRHSREEFVSFLEQVVGGSKPKQEIHVILAIARISSLPIRVITTGTART